MAALKMLSRISSPRSILTAAFYTACWSHPRCWARATENRLPLNPSSCSFLKWEDECISPSPLLTPVLLSAPGLLTQSLGQGWVRGALLSHLSGWQCLLIRHRSAQSSQTCSSPFQRGPSCNAAAKCRELLSPLIAKGSGLGWVKTSVHLPQRLKKHRVHCPEQPEPPSMGQTSCTLLAGSYKHSRTGHLGVQHYWESTLTKITAWAGALWYVCPTSIAKELHLPPFPDLYQSLKSDFFLFKIKWLQ